jgi:hypothetical protein
VSKEEFELMMMHSRQQLYAKVWTLLFLILFSLFSLMAKKTKESTQSGRNLIKLEQPICYVYENGKNIWDQVKHEDPG